MRSARILHVLVLVIRYSKSSITRDESQGVSEESNPSAGVALPRFTAWYWTIRIYTSRSCSSGPGIS